MKIAKKIVNIEARKKYLELNGLNMGIVDLALLKTFGDENEKKTKTKIAICNCS